MKASQAIIRTMPFSHHSHSGQFCGHAQNSLEQVVRAAIAKNMRVFAMTEHMPREEDDLYPEEVILLITPPFPHSYLAIDQ